jgi:hypothetical protein
VVTQEERSAFPSLVSSEVSELVEELEQTVKEIESSAAEETKHKQAEDIGTTTLETSEELTLQRRHLPRQLQLQLLVQCL